MLISVIVTAYNRRSFLKYAIRSVIEQDIPRDYYEVIVIVNFKDQEITDLADNGIIKLIVLDEGTVGEYISSGLKNSSGEIVTFLDDDDIYKTSRLRSILEIFEKYPEVVYYKNDIEIIDSQNNIKNKFNRSSRCRSGIFERQRLLRDGNVQKLQLHLSTTAVRRRVLDPFLEILPKMTHGTDVWFYYMAMSSGELVYLDCEPLTYYRIHDLATTGIHNEFNHFIGGYNSIAELGNEIKDFAVKNDLEKTRYRMLILSVSRAEHVSIRDIIKGFLFYISHISINTRDAEVLAYSIFIILSSILGKKNSGKIASRIIFWFSEAL